MSNEREIVMFGKPPDDEGRSHQTSLKLVALHLVGMKRPIDHAKYARLVVGWLLENLPGETVDEIGRQLGEGTR